MRVGELWLNKLGITVPKPKEQILTLIELLLHSIATKKDASGLTTLLEAELGIKDAITPQALETVCANLELIKLSNSNTVASLYLKLLPDLSLHRQDSMILTCKVYSVSELSEVLKIGNVINNSFKSIFYKAIATINSVLAKDIIVVKRILKEQRYKIIFISNVSNIEQLRGLLIENGIKSLQDMDKYESIWRSKFE